MINYNIYICSLSLSELDEQLDRLNKDQKELQNQLEYWKVFMSNFHICFILDAVDT